MAPFLTALFDGEADENAAKCARVHLLICQRCAHQWLAWNQTRHLIQTQPVAAPPAQHLGRVLMACRLNSQSRRVVSRNWFPKVRTQAAPADLAEAILAQTTRAPIASVTPGKPMKKRLVWRLSPSLALPALGAFLLIASRETWIPSTPARRVAPVRSKVISSVSTPRRDLSKPRFSQTTRPKLQAPEIESRVVLREKTAFVLETRSDAPKTLPRARFDDNAPVLRVVRDSAALNYSRDSAAQQENQALAVEIAAQSLRVALQPISTRLGENSERLPRAELPIEIPQSAPPLRLKAAKFSQLRRAPRPPVLLARLEPRASRLEETIETAPSLRASTPAMTAAIFRPSAPENGDSAFEELPSLVEEYRASLANDAGEESG